MRKGKYCHNELLLPSTEHKECELHRFTVWLLIKSICLVRLSKISVSLEQSRFFLDPGHEFALENTCNPLGDSEFFFGEPLLAHGGAVKGEHT